MSDDNVVSIKQKEVNESLVGILEVLLKDALSGDLDGLMFVGGYEDGAISSELVGRVDALMVGCLDDVKFRYHMLKYSGDKDDG